MPENREQAKEYEVAFVAKLLESETVQRGIDELQKGVEGAQQKSHHFFESIREFIPDLDIFNTLLGAAGVAGIVSFGGIVSMMPQAGRAFARVQQTMRRLAHFLGPILEPAFNAVTKAVEYFASKLMELEGTHNVFGKLAGGVSSVVDRLIELDEKYGVLDKLAGYGGAIIDISFKVVESLPEWAQNLVLVAVGLKVLSAIPGISLLFNVAAGTASWLSGLLAALVGGSAAAGIILGTAIIVISFKILKGPLDDLQEQIESLRKYREGVEELDGLFGATGKTIIKLTDLREYYPDFLKGAETGSVEPSQYISSSSRGSTPLRQPQPLQRPQPIDLRISVDQNGLLRAFANSKSAQNIRLSGG